MIGKLKGTIEEIGDDYVLVDVHGGEWVYAALGDHVFERRRVAVARTQGTDVVLAQGMEPGVRIVTAGAAELFGTEFGTK